MVGEGRVELVVGGGMSEEAARMLCGSLRELVVYVVVDAAFVRYQPRTAVDLLGTASGKSLRVYSAVGCDVRMFETLMAFLRLYGLDFRCVALPICEDAASSVSVCRRYSADTEMLVAYYRLPGDVIAVSLQEACSKAAKAAKAAKVAAWFEAADLAVRAVVPGLRLDVN